MAHQRRKRKRATENYTPVMFLMLKFNRIYWQSSQNHSNGWESWHMTKITVIMNLWFSYSP